MFKNSAGWKKLDTADSKFFTEFQLNSIDFCVNNVDFWKIGHRRILTDFFNPSDNSMIENDTLP
jgi:hypothetical protein